MICVVIANYISEPEMFTECDPITSPLHLSNNFSDFMLAKANLLSCDLCGKIPEA